MMATISAMVHNSGNGKTTAVSTAIVVKDDVEEFNSIASDSGIYERLL